MKKYSIVIGSILLVAAGAIGYLTYRTSLHSVALTLAPTVKQVTVFRENQTASDSDATPGVQLAQTAESTTISLQNGDYYAIPKGDNLVVDKIYFTVKDVDQRITIDPDYTTSYLEKQLTSSLSDIQRSIDQSFPVVAPRYTLVSGQLYKKGDWFGGILAPKDATLDEYKVIVRKNGTSWSVVGIPQIVLTSTTFPKVPTDVLTQTNRLVQ